jgi:signal recognition particle subunit SRP54
MLDDLTQKLTGIFHVLGSKGKLGEKEIDDALRQVRLALLEADVNFRVVREFLSRVRERAVGEEVMRSLTPAQQIIKIVHEELSMTLGGDASPLSSVDGRPAIILLVGLQGSGKTTTAAKLALRLKRSGQHPLLVAADTRRPAAIEQLKLLGAQQDIPVYDGSFQSSPLSVCDGVLRMIEKKEFTSVIFDTQGRLHVDEAMMEELAAIKAKVCPSDVLLTVDAMTGQDAVKIAQEFHNRIGLTGLILTKMDGDARGGASLSIRFVSGVPIKFIGVGEKMDALELFHPDRLASRILGMGDMLTLIENAEGNFSEQRSREIEEKVRAGEFDLENLLEQMRQLYKMGPLSSLVCMLPTKLLKGPIL